MPTHLSFLDDATDRFLRAFELHQELTSAEPHAREIRDAAACVCDLFVAIEKGLKHALTMVDPYLLLKKPDRAMILRMRRDMVSRPVPTIFCGREPLETIGMTASWEALQQVASTTVATAVLNDFERALERLAEVRNRAQHGELYEDVDDMLAAVDQVLARFSEVAAAFIPDWFSKLTNRNGQLESRLTAIQRQIDANWQVLIDHLRARGPISVSVEMYVTQEHGGQPLRVLIGGSDEHNQILGMTDVPGTDASGFLSMYLTKVQAGARYAARIARGLRTTESASSLGAVFLGRTTAPDKPLSLLEPGAIRVANASIWVSLKLPSVDPPNVRISAILLDFSVSFPNVSVVDGAVNGALECAVVRGARPERIVLSGRAYLDAEFCSNEDEPVGADGDGAGRSDREVTIRKLRMNLELAVETKPLT